MDKTSEEYIRAMKENGFFGDNYGLWKISAKLKALSNLTSDSDVQILFDDLRDELDTIIDNMEKITVEDFNKRLKCIYEEMGIKYEMVYLGKDKGCEFSKLSDEDVHA